MKDFTRTMVMSKAELELLSVAIDQLAPRDPVGLKLFGRLSRALKLRVEDLDANDEEQFLRAARRAWDAIAHDVEEAARMWSHEEITVEHQVDMVLDGEHVVHHGLEAYSFGPHAGRHRLRRLWRALGPEAQHQIVHTALTT